MKSTGCFKTERCILVKITTASHSHQLYVKDVTSHLQIWILSSTKVQVHSLKGGYKFVYKLKASITKLKYSWNKQMNKTSRKLTNFTCFFFFFLLFFELLSAPRDEKSYLSFTPSFSQFHHRKSLYLKHLHQEQIT